ncbi:indole-3-glycerol phosphate synthase TrpC [Virgibacillus oceani]|uniref:Indole-3-glycerol phosphate synthase n=1 Tax=Virgibacillus oceani TaxID=1479511 RepID=A0A917HKE6_9BACI|nr:indole-3-glycerol phosphate synthase TrpC [Virgibacillus oceani]GGG81039.1 indole-3-glycerol phosphate synthase [Virgibacillus oceani]
MSILEKILVEKEKEIAQLKTNGIKEFPLIKHNIPSIKQTFPSSVAMNVIAEIKRASPSKGAIDLDVNPAEQAKNYAALGAGAISILTDRTFFKGSMDDLYEVREACNLPLLCKDFFIDPIQIDQAKAAGANIILLIVAAMSEDQLKQMYTYAKGFDLDVLCEVHNESEMESALKLGADIIGINNRNLKTFNVNLSVTETLAPMVKKRDRGSDPLSQLPLLIGESGIKSRVDVERLAKADVSGILVGETLMLSDDLQVTFQHLQVPRMKGSIPNAR